MELPTLSNIKVCTFITGPNGKLQSWPYNWDPVKKFLIYTLEIWNAKKKNKESSTPLPEQEEEQGEKDLLMLIESNLAALNKRIHFMENKNVVVSEKGKRKRIKGFLCMGFYFRCIFFTILEIRIVSFFFLFIWGFTIVKRFINYMRILFSFVVFVLSTFGPIWI